MKITYRPSKFVQVEFEASTDKEIYGELAHIDEILGVQKCGLCGSEDINFVLRTNPKKGYQFPELRCQESKCRAVLSFGQNSDGKTIYPRKRYHAQHPLVKEKEAKEGDYIPGSGWEKRVFNNDEE